MTRDLPVEARRLLAERHGVATRSELARHMEHDQIARLLRRGEWQLAFGRTVVAQSGPLSMVQTLWAAHLVCPDGSALAGHAALRCLTRGVGLGGEGPETRRGAALQVLVPRGAHRPRAEGLDVHTAVSIPRVLPGAMPPHTPAPRSLLDAASWTASPGQARWILLRGVQLGLVTPEHLDVENRRVPRRRHHALLCEVVDDLLGGVRSVPEARFAILARRAGLPAPERQALACTAQGRYYLDVWWPERALAVEVEGVHHAEPEQSARDWHRHNELTIEGRRVLHFTSHAVRHDPDDVIRQLREAWAQGRGPASRARSRHAPS